MEVIISGNIYIIQRYTHTDTHCAIIKNLICLGYVHCSLLYNLHEALRDLNVIMSSLKIKDEGYFHRMQENRRTNTLKYRYFITNENSFMISNYTLTTLHYKQFVKSFHISWFSLLYYEVGRRGSGVMAALLYHRGRAKHYNRQMCDDCDDHTGRRIMLCRQERGRMLRHDESVLLLLQICCYGWRAWWAAGCPWQGVRACRLPVWV